MISYLLITAKANFDSKDKQGHDALFHAVNDANIPVLKSLMYYAQQKNIYLTDITDIFALLYLAKQKNKTDAYNVLLDYAKKIIKK